MDHNQIQQEISIIKKMIEKTKRETAESGHFFIAVGIFSAVATFAIGMLERYDLYHLVLPTLIIAVIACGLIGYLTVTKKEKREKVTSYPKNIFYNMMLACAIPGLMILFLYPLLKVYPWNLIPALVPLIMGIIIFSAGVIFELRYVKWCSLAWWAGALIMALTKSQLRFLIMIAIIIFGWILPGLILNKQYKNRVNE